MTQHNNQRVAVLVDVQNMYYSAKNLHDMKVNFSNILKTAVAGRRLIRAIAYVIRADVKDEHNFHEALDKIGFEVRSKELQTFVGGAKKGDWDVGIAMDAIRLANKVDTIVVVSGDGDFYDLLQHLKAVGCRTEIISFRKTTNTKLLELADTYIDLDRDHNRYLIPLKPFMSKRGPENIGNKYQTFKTDGPSEKTSTGVALDESGVISPEITAAVLESKAIDPLMAKPEELAMTQRPPQRQESRPPFQNQGRHHNNQHRGPRPPFHNNNRDNRDNRGPRPSQQHGGGRPFDNRPPFQNRGPPQGQGPRQDGPPRFNRPAPQFQGPSDMPHYANIDDSWDHIDKDVRPPQREERAPAVERPLSAPAPVQEKKVEKAEKAEKAEKVEKKEKAEKKPAAKKKPTMKERLQSLVKKKD